MLQKKYFSLFFLLFYIYDMLLFFCFRNSSLRLHMCYMRPQSQGFILDPQPLSYLQRGKFRHLVVSKK